MAGRQVKKGTTVIDIKRKIREIGNSEGYQDQHSEEYLNLLQILKECNLPKVFKRDLSKIEFSNEELNFGSTLKLDESTEVLWIEAESDFELPLNYIIYLDPKNQLRGYIPLKGNTYCHREQTAFGTDNCFDCEKENNPKNWKKNFRPDWNQMIGEIWKKLTVV